MVSGDESTVPAAAGEIAAQLEYLLGDEQRRAVRWQRCYAVCSCVPVLIESCGSSTRFDKPRIELL